MDEFEQLAIFDNEIAPLEQLIDEQKERIASNQTCASAAHKVMERPDPRWNSPG